MVTKTRKKTKKFVNKKSYGKVVSLRVPSGLLKTIKSNAELRSLTVGALLRRTIMNAFTMPGGVAIWWD